MDSTAANAAVVPAGTKWTFTARRVTRQDVEGLLLDVSHAVSGDLVLGQITSIGQHKKLQLAEGRYADAYPDDYVVLTCGDRYAQDQFEAIAELDREGADLVAGGGVIGSMRQAHGKMAAPTKVRPLGLLLDSRGEVINVARYALPYRAAPADMPVIAVVGVSMNAGKTTATASLAHGLKRAGHAVAAIKITGTGAFGDFNAYLDAGIPVVADFTDAGMASTYRQPIDRIERAFDTLLGHAREQGAEVAVVELADGICQAETTQLLRDSTVRDRLDGVLFAARDSMGATGGVAILRQMGLEPFAISGLVSCSPLASVEARALTHVPVVSRDELQNPDVLAELVRPFMAPFPTLDNDLSAEVKTAA